MVDGDVGRPLIEVVDRIATFTHDVGQKPVRVVQRCRRTVDESGLHLPPAMRVSLKRVARQRTDIELVSVALAANQFLFCRLLLAGLRNGPVVFRAELLPETIGSFTTLGRKRDDCSCNGDQDKGCYEKPYPYRHLTLRSFLWFAWRICRVSSSD